MDRQELLKLVLIGPGEVYNFNDDTILLTKLEHNVDLRALNGTHPFDELIDTDPYATDVSTLAKVLAPIAAKDRSFLHLTESVVSEIWRNNPNVDLCYSSRIIDSIRAQIFPKKVLFRLP